jgi:hypothetical protein
MEPSWWLPRLCWLSLQCPRSQAVTSFSPNVGMMVVVGWGVLKSQYSLLHEMIKALFVKYFSSKGNQERKVQKMSKTKSKQRQNEQHSTC